MQASWLAVPSVSGFGTALPKVVVVGGGFSGACSAIQLLRQHDQPLDVVLIEPRSRLGCGLAYGSVDPDHRLNAPAPVHVVLADQPAHLEQWLQAQGRTARDAEALCGSALYPRRADFGEYVGAQLHRFGELSMSRFQHSPQRAITLERAAHRLRITLESGASLEADACIVATGHESPSAPAGVGRDVATHPLYVHDPWDVEKLSALEPRGEVLLIGTGLTAADVVATLSRRPSLGRITALSRHGFVPADQNPTPGSRSIWESVTDPLPAFVARHGTPARVREILRILRADIEARARAGGSWQDAFDEVRNAIRWLWRALPQAQKRRFLRHARALYDAHRFRLAPQTSRILQDARSSGRLQMLAGRIHSIGAAREGFDVEYVPRGRQHVIRHRFGAIINCTGPELSARRSRNPFVRSLLDAGLACEDDVGIGLASDERFRVLDARGAPVPGLYVIGPPSRGMLGETPAVPVITWQALGIVADLQAGLRRPGGLFPRTR